MKKYFVVLIFTSLFFTSFSQTKKWTIKSCVDYAVKNNLSVKQADITARIAALQYKQAKLNVLPTANFSTGIFDQFGRTIDRTTNSFSNESIINQNLGLQGNIDIFNFGRIKHNIAAQEFNVKAALADIEKTANDVALSVAIYFLNVVVAQKQIDINNVQIAQSKNSLILTQKKVAAGALPELNALQFESQLANDSSNYVAVKTTYDQALLTLKGVLNLDAAETFEVEIPNLDEISLMNLLDMQPENLYVTALKNQPSMKANFYRMASLEKSILNAKAQMNPSVSGSFSLFSNYTNKAFEVTDVTLKNTVSGFTTINGTNYNVFSYDADFKTKKTDYFKQLDNNFGQSVGLSISVPLFNNGNLRNNYEQSKMNLQLNKITLNQIEQKLKIDIYTAYTNAINALQKFNASKKQLNLNEKTYEFAYKRFEIGILSSFDMIMAQTNLQRVKAQLLSDHYDYIFKMKLLEFYKGEGLKF